MAWLTYCVLVLVFVTTVDAADPTKGGFRMRIVTWNVAENNWAPKEKGFTPDSIDTVLGLKDKSLVKADLYAIALQEECWKCSDGKHKSISDKFIDRLNGNSGDTPYKLIGIHALRLTSYCQTKCNVAKKIPGVSYHGITLVMVIAKTNGKVFDNPKKVSHIEKCSSLPTGDEWNAKGVAGLEVKVQLGKNEPKVLCFGGLHLDSKEPSFRQSCIGGFFKASNWSNICAAQYLFGDFNTRTATAGKGDDKTGKKVSSNFDFTNLKKLDELNGQTPWTKPEGQPNLLAFINAKNAENTLPALKKTEAFKTFSEEEVKFLPTYSIFKKCGTLNEEYCYLSNRPKSWTDRIIFTQGEVQEYSAIQTQEYGDHFPVYADIVL